MQVALTLTKKPKSTERNWKKKLAITRFFPYIILMNKSDIEATIAQLRLRMRKSNDFFETENLALQINAMKAELTKTSE